MSFENVDIDQKELFKNASERIKQKKRLVHHLVFFVAGIIIFAFINLILNYGIDFKPLGMPWFFSAGLLWSFFLIAHAINVLLVERLMNRAWKERYMNKLVEKQLINLKKLQAQVDKKYPLEDNPISEQMPEDDSQ